MHVCVYIYIYIYIYIYTHIHTLYIASKNRVKFFLPCLKTTTWVSPTSERYTLSQCPISSGVGGVCFEKKINKIETETSDDDVIMMSTGLSPTHNIQKAPMKHNSKLKLQAEMKGPSHPSSPPSRGHRKTVNGGQYAFKVVNIGGIWYTKCPVASRWHYYYNWTLALRHDQARTLIKHVMFGVDRTLHG